MQRTRLALAGCIICDEHGGVLMLHRNTPGRVQWEIPGGAVDADETPQAAAIRELREEMAVQVRVVRHLGQRQFTEDDKEFDYTWFLAVIVGGEPTLVERDLYDKWGFFSLVTLTQRYDELSPNTKNFLEAMAYGEIELEV